jgi:ADP-ribosylglycohydrolase
MSKNVSIESISLDDWDNKMEVEVKLAEKVGSEFQIRTSEAVSVALLSFILHWKFPSEVIMACISYGGDTDTTGSIAAGLVGALHGSKWIPQEWFDGLENMEYGRDYAISLATKLSTIDLQTI